MIRSQVKWVWRASIIPVGLTQLRPTFVCVIICFHSGDAQSWIKKGCLVSLEVSYCMRNNALSRKLHIHRSVCPSPICVWIQPPAPLKYITVLFSKLPHSQASEISWVISKDLAVCACFTIRLIWICERNWDHFDAQIGYVISLSEYSPLKKA